MDDREMLKVLREALLPVAPSSEEDPPGQVLEAAYAAGEWLLIDDRLAELVQDSSDSLVASGLRGPDGDTRQLTYQVDDLTIDCELTPDTLVGQIAPAAGLTVELVDPAGQGTLVELDDEGRFLVRPRPRGPVGLRCTRADRPRVLTPWLLA
jgi:hypothetical protein